jgi:hypothetical protein
VSETRRIIAADIKTDRAVTHTHTHTHLKLKILLYTEEMGRKWVKVTEGAREFKLTGQGVQ